MHTHTRAHTHTHIMITNLDPLLQLFKVRFSCLYLAGHQKMANLDDQIEGANKQLLMTMVVLHEATSLVQHLTCLLVPMVNQKELYIGTHIHMYMHTYLYTYIHTRIHTYTHAYIHTCIQYIQFITRIQTSYTGNPYTCKEEITTH